MKSNNGKPANSQPGPDEMPARRHASDLEFYLDSSPPFYFPLLGFKGHAAVIHRRCNHFVRYWFRLKNGPRLLAKILLWPAYVLYRISHKTRKYGAFVKEKTGKSACRQFIEQLVLVLGRGLPPTAYHKFQLFMDERRAVAGEYIHRYETKPFLFPLLNRHAKKKLLNDKQKFYRHCCAHGLPTPQNVARFPDTKSKNPLRLPARGLISKPRNGKGGFLVTRWSFQDGLYHSPDGLRFDSSELVSHLDHLAANTGRIVLQELLSNHPSLPDPGGGALNTLRVITCRNFSDQPEAVCAVFRISSGKGSVDNFHAGGVASAVCLETGKLSAAIGLRIKSRNLQTHPARPVVQIEGRVLPHLHEALALASRAHEASGAFTIIGWDVALTPNGPVLVEGNTNTDLDIIQRTHGCPVGQMLLGRYLVHQLQKISGDEIVEFLRAREKAQRKVRRRVGVPNCR